MIEEGRVTLHIGTKWLFLAVGWIGLSLVSCNRTELPQNSQTKRLTEISPIHKDNTPQDILYEDWSTSPERLHFYHHGFAFEPGMTAAQKYLERKQVSPWATPERITEDVAKSEALPWAAQRDVRWLKGTTATFHFPLYPDEFKGNLYLTLELRPKINPSLAVRFYAPNDDGSRSWSQPLTADIQPKWARYRWQIPKAYLDQSGAQLMRVSFPGSYFEGENRVSAKFVRIGIESDANQPKISPHNPERTDIAPADAKPFEIPTPTRVLSDEKLAFQFENHAQIDRYLNVPNHAFFHFYAAPGAWLETAGTLRVSITTDESNAADESQIPITPGDSWQMHRISLEKYSGKNIRLSVRFSTPINDDGFSHDAHNGALFYLSSPQIVVRAPQLQMARESFSNIRRVVVLAIDNLRADRIANIEHRRGTKNLSFMSDEGLSGIVMGEALSPVAMIASFLTASHASQHGVTAPNIHLKQSITTLSEWCQQNHLKSFYFSTSGLVDAALGFAQGFDEVRQLNRENIFSSRDALNEVSQSLKNHNDRAFYYVHLSELRLPYNAPNERMAQWGVPNYSGSVTPSAMQNQIVMTQPLDADKRQLAAYYDGELSKIDDAIGDFIQTLPDDTAVLFFGTHGNSLGESALGYELSLSPWELLMPYALYAKGKPVRYHRPGIVRASQLASTVKELLGLPTSENDASLFTAHDTMPTAMADGVQATAAQNTFYRIRREGVDILYDVQPNHSSIKEISSPAVISRQTMRERIE